MQSPADKPEPAPGTMEPREETMAAMRQADSEIGLTSYRSFAEIRAQVCGE